MKYEYKSRIRYSECDEDRKLHMPGLVNYFQDTCTFQGDDLGIGWEKILELGYAWMITYWQIDVDRMPKMSEHVKFVTWPYDFNAFLGQRNFVVEDENGNILAKGNSVWVLMDVEAQKPARVPDEITKRYEMYPKLDMEYAPRKIRLLKAEEASICEETPFRIERAHLDTNHHVNNGQYIAMAQEYIPDAVSFRRMRAEYKMQARLGDMIYPRIAHVDGIWQIALNNENGKTYAVIEYA